MHTRAGPRWRWRLCARPSAQPPVAHTLGTGPANPGTGRAPGSVAQLSWRWPWSCRYRIPVCGAPAWPPVQIPAVMPPDPGPTSTSTATSTSTLSSTPTSASLSTSNSTYTFTSTSTSASDATSVYPRRANYKAKGGRLRALGESSHY